MKTHVQSLVQKSDNDDCLVAALQQQLGRGNEPTDNATGAIGTLRKENAELQAQVERQAQILQQLRQKSFTSTVDTGSARLGASTPSTPSGALVERVRYLEAENARQSEHIRLLRGSGSADASLGARDQVQLLEHQLANSERDNERLRLSLQRKGSEGELYYPQDSPGDASSDGQAVLA